MSHTQPRYLIWSNQHTMWWRPGKSGYTGVIEEAGRYLLGDAQMIVDQATVGGQLAYERVDPVTGRPYRMVDEVLVLAPEHVAEQVGVGAQ